MKREPKRETATPEGGRIPILCLVSCRRRQHSRRAPAPRVRSLHQCQPCRLLQRMAVQPGRQSTEIGHVCSLGFPPLVRASDCPGSCHVVTRECLGAASRAVNPNLFLAPNLFLPNTGAGQRWDARIVGYRVFCMNCSMFTATLVTLPAATSPRSSLAATLNVRRRPSTRSRCASARTEAPTGVGQMCST